jgi:hypothetical protein
MAGDYKPHFDVQITPNCGHVYSRERAEQVVREFETQTTSKYSCYKSRLSFSRTGMYIINNSCDYENIKRYLPKRIA